MNTATSDVLMESTVKPISRAPWKAASTGAHSFLDVASDVFQHDDGVVHHEAGRNGQRHQGKIVQAVVQQIHHAESSDQRQGDRNAGNEGGAEGAQKRENHQDDQDDRNQQSEFDVMHRGAHRGGAVQNYADVNRRRNGRLEQRQRGAHPIHGRDDVRARLPEDDDQDGGLAAGQPDVADVLD